MIYPVKHEDISANALQAIGRHDWITLQRVPGRKNMSHEECVDGWLGTTGRIIDGKPVDDDAIALGEFEADDIDGIVEIIADNEFEADEDEIREWNYSRIITAS